MNSANVVISGKDELRRDFAAASNLLTAPRLVKLCRIGPRKFLQRWLARRFPSLATPRDTRLFWGERMSVMIPDAPSETLYTYGVFDPDVTSLVLSVVSSGACVIDVGAHFGYISLLCSKLVGDSGRIVSLEPTPSTFAILQKNTSRFHNITALQAAVGDVTGTATLRDYGVRYVAFNTLAPQPRLGELQWDGAADEVEVELTTIDDIVRAHSLEPTFVKLDVENYEDKALAGMQRTLELFRPAVLVEMGSPQALDAAQRLLTRGYAPHVRQPLGDIESWGGSLEEMNDMYKDVLFLSDGP
jgi:FkbM family methyltransferase